MSFRDRPDFEGETVTIGSDTATVGELIDSGQEGYVYHVKGSSDDVIKIFNEDRRDKKEPKIKAMIKNKPTDRTFDKKGIRSIIWPEKIVSEASESFWGYQMPYVNVDETVTAFQYADDPTYLAGDDTEPTKRFRTARNLAIMVHNIHREGHAIGDFNDENMRIWPNNDVGYVALLDCDSYWIQGEGRIYNGSTYHTRYAPPQQLGNSLTAVQKGDRFCLGVHIFQLIMQGHHPYKAAEESDDAEFGNWGDIITGTPFPYQETEHDVQPPKVLQKRYDRLPTELKELFNDCFGHGSKDATMGRPEPIEWIKVLNNLIETTGPGGGGGGGGGGGDPPGGTENPFSDDDSTKPESGGSDSDNKPETGGSDGGDNDDTDDAPGDTTVPF